MQQNEESRDQTYEQEKEFMSFSHMTSVIWRIDSNNVIYPFLMIDTPTTYTSHTIAADTN